MADDFEVKIEGLEEVLANLDHMPRNIVKQAYARALTAATVPIVQELNTRTPEDTGDLIDHLVTDVSIHSDGLGGTAQIGFGSRGAKARFVEYGHRMIGHKPGSKDEGTVQPHPFMAPAAASGAEAAIEAFAESLRESLSEGISKVA